MSPDKSGLGNMQLPGWSQTACTRCQPFRGFQAVVFLFGEVP